MTPDQPLELQGTLWLTAGGEHFGGANRLVLLAKIAECGSITGAAKAAGMSYKAAWDAIDTMNNLAGEPLVERATGGKGGGGTRLTSRGVQLVHNFQLVEQEHRRFIESLGRHGANLADEYLLIRRISMRTSARNQFLGKVTSVKPGAVNDEIELEVAGGQRIVAIITHGSTQELGLAPGADAYALVKASSIILVAADETARFSARNRLRGTVSRVQAGAVNTEVVIDLAGGVALAAIVTRDSGEALELAEGKEVTAIFKASSVILAVPD